MCLPAPRGHPTSSALLGSVTVGSAREARRPLKYLLKLSPVFPKESSFSLMLQEEIISVAVTQTLKGNCHEPHDQLPLQPGLWVTWAFGKVQV